MTNSIVGKTATATTPSRSARAEWIPKTPASKRAAQKRLDGVTTMPDMSTLLSTPRRLRQEANARRVQSSPAFGDRFIPNRACMDMDRCSASIRASEKRRLEALPLAAACRRRKLASSYENDDVFSPPRSISERQEEFRRQMMESVLFGIPAERLESRFTTRRSRKSNSPRSVESFLTPNLAPSTLENPADLVYSSLPELLDEARDMQASDSRLMNRENMLIFFNNSVNGSSGSRSRRLPDPYSHDALRVLDRSVSQSFDRRKKSTTRIGDSVKIFQTSLLDAPGLKDDYYLNLLSWSADNILAVVLGQNVYIYNVSTKETQQFSPNSSSLADITSVSWSTMPGQTHVLAVGMSDSTIEVWDAEAFRLIRTVRSHSDRVCALAWNSHLLTSGSRDSAIHHQDLRDSCVAAILQGHKREVCGLKWNLDGTTLASGGNDDYVCIWDANVQSGNGATRPRHTLKEHKAGVKALAWSPFHRHKLVSGGGAADQRILSWNTNNGSVLNSVYTCSQVSSLLWSKSGSEIISAHGYNHNNLTVWNYPTMTKIQDFGRHTNRVLNMDTSPDGLKVAALSSDETLSFWNVFKASPGDLSLRIEDVQLGNSIIR